MIEALAKGYFVSVYDYHRDSTGLLVSSGAGTMCSVMDACPVFRWCLDIDENKDAERLARFLVCADVLVNPLGVVGWFSITPPDALQAALRRLPNLGRVLVYTQQATMPGGFHFTDLGAFIRAANDYRRVTAGVLNDADHWESRNKEKGKRDDTTRDSISIFADENLVPSAEAQPIRAHSNWPEALRISRPETVLGKTSEGPAL